MEVMPGPTFSIEVSEYGNDPPATATATEKASSSYSSGETANDERGVMSRSGNGIWSGHTADYSSESSSSIGTPGDSEEEEDDDDEVTSKEIGLSTMSSLEDSLPSNRKGLSNHYKGKSKSFGNLGEIGSVKEVPKQENPLNKRRRLQICNKLARKSFYSWQNPKSMPLLPVNEDEDDEEEEEEEEEEESRSSDEERGGGGRRGGVVVARKHSFKNRAYKSQSCFALSDLQEEEDE